jgi:Tfp pilus assembly protein PilO
LLIIFAIRPTLITISTINTEIKEKTRLNTALDSKIDTLSKLDKQYTEMKEDLSHLKLIYPDNKDFSLFMANTTGILSKNGFTLSGINFDNYGEDNFDLTTKVLAPWSVRLNIKGRPSNLVNLLKDLEALPMYPVIESLSFSSQKDENGLTGYSISLRIYEIENNNFYE